MIRAAILSSSASTRTSLRERLAQEADVRVVAEADGVRSLPLEVDVVLATEEAAEALLQRWEALVRRRPAPRLAAVLLLSTGTAGASGTGGGPRLAAAAERLAALPLPAWGLLDQDSAPESLAAAVRALQAGLIVNSPRRAALPRGAWSPANGVRDRGELPQLTPREAEVLRLLARGAGNKQIAWELGVSEHTVKFHTSAIYAKLGVANRTEALRRGVELGLLSL